MSDVIKCNFCSTEAEGSEVALPSGWEKEESSTALEGKTIYFVACATHGGATLDARLDTIDDTTSGQGKGRIFGTTP